MPEKKPLSLYIHVPFCESRCHYCDFYSNTNFSPELKNRYTMAIMNTIAAPINREEYLIKSVYFGGGTPALLGAVNIGNVLDKIKSSYLLDENCEITLETNPNSASETDFISLKNSGVNRISVGVQSLNDDILSQIGRSHNSTTALECIDMLSDSGFDNLSVDLMFGLPDQNCEMLLDNLDKITTLENKISHISMYDLKLEPGTVMYNKRNMFSFPDDDEEADMYYAASEFLAQKGFEHYEISNFAKKGFRSVHNMNYWQSGDFLGFGASAHSRYNNKLFSISPDMHLFIENAEKGGTFFTVSNYNDVKTMADDEIDEVYIIMSLRTSDGLDISRLKKPDEFLNKASRFLNAGMMLEKDGNYRLLEKSFFVSNQILSYLI